MDKISREQIELLIALQETEAAAAKIQVMLDALPLKITELEAGLKEFEDAIALEKETLAELKKAYRSWDAEIQTNQTRVKKREEQLRAVKTNKEYQVILKEIDEIKKANSRIEDETIACLDKIDAAENAVKEKQAACLAEEAEMARQKAVFSAEADADRQALNELLGKRNALCEKIDDNIMRLYENIKANARGIAVVQVKNCICTGCHMNIPPQMYNELHRENELRTCPHCHRMLYVVH